MTEHGSAHPGGDGASAPTVGAPTRRIPSRVDADGLAEMMIDADVEAGGDGAYRLGDHADLVHHLRGWGEHWHRIYPARGVEPPRPAHDVYIGRRRVWYRPIDLRREVTPHGTPPIPAEWLAATAGADEHTGGDGRTVDPPSTPQTAGLDLDDLPF